MSLTPSAMKLLKNYVIYIIQQILEQSIVKTGKITILYYLTILLEDENSITEVTVTTATKKVLETASHELFRHALSEGQKSIKLYETNLNVMMDKDQQTNSAGLVFPIRLFEDIGVQAYDVNFRYFDLHAQVFLSAIAEYISAEVIELGCKFANIFCRSSNL
jgi:hypothetical protein